MRKILFALSGAAIAMAAIPAGVCVSTHRVKGTPPYKIGYVFGPNYSYTTYGTLPGPVTSYYHLDSNGRYVYSNGYVYVVDPTTYAVTRVIDPFSQ